MASPMPVIVTLDRPREIAWTMRARIRLNSLERQATRPGLYQIASVLWAMVDDDREFPKPEDLGQYMKTRDEIKALGDALLKAQAAAEDSEKNGPGSTQKPGRASS